MRKLLQFILFIPRLVLSIVWNLFWGLFKTALVLALVLLGLLYYANHSTSNVASVISNTIANVTSYFENADSQTISNDLSEISTDDFTYYSGARWSSNSATVYIETTDETLISAYRSAIDSWNTTGAFTFTLTDDENEADIVAMDYSDATSQAAGLAETQTNALTNQITHVDVMLNTYYLTENDYGYTMERIINTAEHELGHAIGLDHDDNETSVMQSSGSYYGIQEADIAKVETLYAD